MADDDEYSRMVRLGSFYKQILEMTPYDQGCRDLMRDRRFLRYFILCLPLHESVVENTIMSLLFKLQGSLYFLKIFNSALNRIFKLKDPKGANWEATVVKKTNVSFMADIKEEDNFQYFVEKMAPLVVRINFSKIKFRCIDYLGKIIEILDKVSCIY